MTTDLVERMRRASEAARKSEHHYPADALLEGVDRIERLEAAIREHRDAVKCCDECATAQAEDRETDDGRLWSHAD